MSKKYYFLILLVFLVVVGAGYFMLNQDNGIRIGDVNYKVPDGYSVSESDTVYNLTNGDESISLVKKTSYNDIKDVTKQYKKVKAEKNIKINFTNFTAGDVQVYESHSNKEPNIAHYWFAHKGVVYEIISNNKTDNTDNVVSDLISNIELK